jgi:hypothetical protein
VDRTRRDFAVGDVVFQRVSELPFDVDNFFA